MALKGPSELHVLIMAGGPGTRLWPLSNDALPKPYLPIPGPRSLIQDTYDRARLLVPNSHIWVVALKEQYSLLRKHLPQVPRDRLLLEPEARNTAAAIAFGTAAILKKDPHAVIAVLPADHVVEKPAALAGALATAARFCRKNYGIVCIGIRPTEPSTGYGYLEFSRGKTAGVHKLRRFIEKPPAAKAVRLVKSGALWNGGMFVFRGEVFLNELEKHEPALHCPVAKALQSKDSAAVGRYLTRHYPELPVISVDYAVMEKTAHAFGVSCACGWSDVGSWTEALRVSGGEIHTPRGKALRLEPGRGRVAGKRLYESLGQPEVILIETPEATLILHPGAAADVGKLAKEVAARNRRKNPVQRRRVKK